MAFISVTRLRIRSLRFLPAFAWHAVRSSGQLRGMPGFLGGSLLADRRWTFWTLTAWRDAEAMRHYMTTGAHRAAMPLLPDWCDEAAVVHWERPGTSLPSWIEAAERLRASGRPSKVRHPGARHASLDYLPPRTSLAGPITSKGA